MITTEAHNQILVMVSRKDFDSLYDVLEALYDSAYERGYDNGYEDASLNAAGEDI